MFLIFHKTMSKVINENKEVVKISLLAVRA